MTSVGHNDRLTAMLYAQRDLQHRAYGHEPGKMEPAELMAYVRDNALALTDEIHEALNETGWKPWASSNHLHTTAYLGELIDAWHFLMNMMLATGIPPEVLADRVYEGYMMKQVRNAKRQAEGYDGISTKCPGCGRALDDVAVKCYQDLDRFAGVWCSEKREIVLSSS